MGGDTPYFLFFPYLQKGKKNKTCYGFIYEIGITNHPSFKVYYLFGNMPLHGS